MVHWWVWNRPNNGKKRAQSKKKFFFNGLTFFVVLSFFKGLLMANGVHRRWQSCTFYPRGSLLTQNTTTGRPWRPPPPSRARISALQYRRSSGEENGARYVKGHRPARRGTGSHVQRSSELVPFVFAICLKTRFLTNFRSFGAFRPKSSWVTSEKSI